MEWPKLKNIIILILLLVNGFLLVLVVGREFQVSRYELSPKQVKSWPKTASR